MASGLNHCPPGLKNSGSDQIWIRIQNTGFRSGAAWWWRRRICWTSWRMLTTQSASRPRTRSSPLNRKQIRYGTVRHIAESEAYHVWYDTTQRRFGSRIGTGMVGTLRYIAELEADQVSVRYDTSSNRKQIRYGSVRLTVESEADQVWYGTIHRRIGSRSGTGTVRLAAESEADQVW
jgi:hypothetical protein